MSTTLTPPRRHSMAHIIAAIQRRRADSRLSDDCGDPADPTENDPVAVEVEQARDVDDLLRFRRRLFA